MVRVTDEQVQRVVDIPSGVEVETFIEVASRLVDDVLASAGLSSGRLADIELYLSAHLVALTEEGGGITMQRTGASSIQYAQLKGEGLKLTRFGQIALDLDTSGKLKASVRPKARGQFLGGFTKRGQTS